MKKKILLVLLLLLILLVGYIYSQINLKSTENILYDSGYEKMDGMGYGKEVDGDKIGITYKIDGLLNKKISKIIQKTKGKANLAITIHNDNLEDYDITYYGDEIGSPALATCEYEDGELLENEGKCTKLLEENKNELNYLKKYINE